MRQREKTEEGTQINIGFQGGKKNNNRKNDLFHKISLLCIRIDKGRLGSKSHRDTKG